MRCGDSVIMPDQFIPLIVQFNLSQRFDMLVLETLFSVLHQHAGQRFSVNLLPATLMQRIAPRRLSRCFNAMRSHQTLSLLKSLKSRPFPMPTSAGKILKRCARLAAPSPLMTLAPDMRTMND